MRVRLACAGLALAIALLPASRANAAPAQVDGLSWLLSFNLKLEQHLVANCTFQDSLGWSYHGPPRSHARDYGTFPPQADPATGSYDAAARRGTAKGKGGAMIFDPLFASQGSGGKAFELVDMGVDVRPHKVFLTGVIKPTRSRAAARKRQRVAVIGRPRFSQGRRPDDLGKPMSSSYRYAVAGKAKMTRALAKALNRARCTAPRFAAHSKGNGPIKPGTTLGKVTIGLLPPTAIGVAGHVYFEKPMLDLVNDDDGSRVSVTPVAAVEEKINRTRYYRFDLAPGSRVALACQYGANCVPAPGAAMTLVGGLRLTYHGITATLDGLTVTIDPSGNPTTAARLNGTPVTVEDDLALTDDFVNRAGAVFGVPVAGDLAPVQTLFSGTAAAQ